MPLQLLTPPTTEPLSLAQAKSHLRVTTTDEDALISGLIAATRAYAQAKTQRQIIGAKWKLVMDSFPGPSLVGVPYGKAFTLPEHAILLPLAGVLQVVSIDYTDMGGNPQTMTPLTDYVVDLSCEPVRITPPFGRIWPIPLPQIGSVSVTFLAGEAVPLVADTVGDTISVPGWKTMAVGDTLRLSNRDLITTGDGVLPAPLLSMKDYYVQSVAGPDLYQLSLTSGGAVIDITSAGTGESFIGTIPQGLARWMTLSMGTLYENREAVMVDTRISAAELPLEFIDGLLDPYRLVVY